jgi:hypothetical protein
MKWSGKGDAQRAAFCYFFPQKSNQEENSGFVVNGYSLLYS